MVGIPYSEVIVPVLMPLFVWQSAPMFVHSYSNPNDQSRTVFLEQSTGVGPALRLAGQWVGQLVVQLVEQ